jgi:probable rRNA maturation factor
MRIRKGRLIPRTDGKRIEELVGAVHTGTDSVSVARMLAPPGWREPAQQPEFDEVVLVLTGALTLVVNGKRERIAAGEVGLVPRGSRVVYRNDGAGACDYFSVCAPAFRPHLAHMEQEAPRSEDNRVVVDSAHPRARAHARRLAQLGSRYLTELGLTGRELSLSLVGDTAIRRLNRTWRRKDKPTDVLSFPAGPLPRGTPGPVPVGDVVISLDTARRQAEARGRPLEEELARYLAHGLLHLLGYDHERGPAAARKMAALEERLLGAQGMVGESLRSPSDRPRPSRKRAGRAGRRPSR